MARLHLGRAISVPSTPQTCHVGPAWLHLNQVFRFPRLTPFVKKLLIGLFGAFVLSVIAENWMGVPVRQLIALNPGDLGWQTLWQIFTYPAYYPPTGLGSLLLTLVFTWWMLAPFEERYGARRTMQLCVTTIVAGGVPVAAMGVLGFGAGELLFGSNVLVISAITAFVWPMRHQRTPIMLFGVLPMRPLHLLYALLGFSALSFLVTQQAAHLVGDLGAIGGGIWFITWMTKPRARGGQQGRKKKKKKKPKAPFEVIEGGLRDSDKPPRYLN